jgi:hypothetical protein
MKQTNKEVYIPTDDFYKFALEFSKDFELLSEGVYRSDDERYIIEYSEIINDIHTKDGIFRVGTNTGNINISKSRVKRDGISSFGVLFIIIWANVYFNTQDRIKSDDISIRYMLSKGSPIKDILHVFKKMFRNPSTEAVKRMKKISNYIENYKNNNNASN